MAGLSPKRGGSSSHCSQEEQEIQAVTETRDMGRDEAQRRNYDCSAIGVPDRHKSVEPGHLPSASQSSPGLTLCAALQSILSVNSRTSTRETLFPGVKGAL